MRERFARHSAMRKALEARGLGANAASVFAIKLIKGGAHPDELVACPECLGSRKLSCKVCCGSGVVSEKQMAELRS